MSERSYTSETMTITKGINQNIRYSNDNLNDEMP